MSRVSPLRLCSTAGLTLGVAAAGLAFAPAALAAEGDLPALTGGTTAVVGQPFTLSGVDCDALGEDPAFVYVDFYTKAPWDDPNGEPALSLKGNPKDGDWSATATFTSAATTGAYVAAAVCEPYADAFTFYPEFSFTLQAAPAAPTTPSATPSATPTVARPARSAAPRPTPRAWPARTAVPRPATAPPPARRSSRSSPASSRVRSSP